MRFRNGRPYDHMPCARRQRARQDEIGRILHSGGGQPLSDSVRRFMEPRFTYNFSRVQVHDCAQSTGLNRYFNSRAFTYGNHIYFSNESYRPDTVAGKRLLAHELTHVVQQDRIQTSGEKSTPGSFLYSPPKVMRKISGWPELLKGQVARKRQLKLLTDFEKTFPKAANLVRKSPDAMKLVKLAATKGVKFGGFSKTKHGQVQSANTIGRTVYFNGKRIDGVVAFSDFIFEVNNAMREPKFDAVKHIARKRKIKAKQFAYRMVAVEVESMLSTAMVWSKMRKSSHKGKAWGKYDKSFYLALYNDYKAGKKTKKDLIKIFLKRKYKHRPFKGWSVEKTYMWQYQFL